MQSKQFTRLQRLCTLALLLPLLGCRVGTKSPEDPWREMEQIRAWLRPPDFPAKEFFVTSFGAVGDGVKDCSSAFASAIEECRKSGGGHVVVPRGAFLTGPIRLKSNVDLHLAEGAVVKFLRDPHAYVPPVPTRWEGVELLNYSPFIYACEDSNIAVTGRGVLDGQANPEFWWPWKGSKESGWKEGMPNQLSGRKRLFEMGEQGIPVDQRRFGEGWYLRPNFIQPYRCINVLIEGVKIIDSPMWEVHPVLCRNVIVRDIVIDSHGPNNDGVDPESCSDVLIERCLFNTGDDCIAIKSGRNNDGRRVNVPSSNIVIRDCSFKDGHGGVAIGSEISGGARNIFAEHCEFESPVLYNALRIKSNAVRGGTIERVYVRDFTVKVVGRAAIDVDLFYEEGKNGTFLPTVRDICVERMIVHKCAVAFNLVGYTERPIQDVLLKDCTFSEAAAGYTVTDVAGFQAENTTVNGRAVQLNEIETTK